jgi:hypothetical protein
MLAHLRTEAYPVYGRRSFPPREKDDVALSYEENVRRIEAAKQDLEHVFKTTSLPSSTNGARST